MVLPYLVVMTREYYVYIVTDPRHTVLYTGVTNDLVKRLSQHRDGQAGFTSKYHCTKLVMYEVFRDSYNAVTREKQIKAGSRRSKIELIEHMNPEWRDLLESFSHCEGGRPEAIRWITPPDRHAGCACSR
jgi:putative endonuclease